MWHRTSVQTLNGCNLCIHVCCCGNGFCSSSSDLTPSRYKMNKLVFRLTSLVAGFLFGLGMIISGMADPAKVIGFLDVAGAWDPSSDILLLSFFFFFPP